ncbi:hypothetical protein C8R45DRAFT_1010349, partial [Mycena sanguinolenta]
MPTSFPRDGVYHIINKASAQVLIMPRPIANGGRLEMRADVVSWGAWAVKWLSNTSMRIQAIATTVDYSVDPDFEMWLHISRGKNEVEAVDQHWPCSYNYSQSDGCFEILDAHGKLRMVYDAPTNKVITEDPLVFTTLGDHGKWRLEARTSPYLLRNFSNYPEFMDRARYHIVNYKTGKALWLPKTSAVGAPIQLTDQLSILTEWAVTGISGPGNTISIKTFRAPNLVLHISRGLQRVEATDEQDWSCQALQQTSGHFVITDPKRKYRMQALATDMTASVVLHSTAVDDYSVWRIEPRTSPYIVQNFKNYKGSDY